jgi:hypothetical protein
VGYDPAVDLGPGPRPATYRHLGKYSDWVEFAVQQKVAPAPPERVKLTTSLVREILGFAADRPPISPRVDATWAHDGVVGQEVSWSVGYGPRTQAWLLRPAGTLGPLPGVLALHDHSNFKFFGKEKIADGPGSTGPPARASACSYLMSFSGEVGASTWALTASPGAATKPKK